MGDQSLISSTLDRIDERDWTFLDFDVQGLDVCGRQLSAVFPFALFITRPSRAPRGLGLFVLTAIWSENVYFSRHNGVTLGGEAI